MASLESACLSESIHTLNTYIIWKLFKELLKINIHHECTPSGSADCENYSSILNISGIYFN